MAWMQHEILGPSWLLVSAGVFTVGRTFIALPTQVKAHACLQKSTVMCWVCLKWFHGKEDTLQVNFTLACPDCCCSKQHCWHSTLKSSSFQFCSSGKCAIIPQANFNTIMTVFCALPVRFPSNAVTCFKSNRCTKVTSHHKCTVILESIMARAKVTM